MTRHAEQPVAEWRRGVTTRLQASAATGASALCLMEQWIEPGAGVPAHTHPGVEEVLTVLAGRAGFWLEGERLLLGTGTSVVIPAGARHGLENAGRSTLRLQAAFAAGSPPAVYDAEPETVIEIGGREGDELDATRRRRIASSMRTSEEE